MKITCKVLKTNETFIIEAEAEEMGKVLISRIAAKLGQPEECIRVIAQQAILKENKTLDENKVTEGSVV